MFRICGRDPFGANLALDAFFFHQPSDPPATQLLTLAKQLLVNAGTAIDLPRLQPNFLDELQQALVFFGAIGGTTPHPAVITASAYIEYLEIGRASCRGRG